VHIYIQHLLIALKVPFDSEDNQGIVYVWIGKRSNTDEARLAEEIAEEIYGQSHRCVWHL